ncbi:Dynamin-related protein 5A [Hibiscus syriacus]|uniref:Dynamin-related protein 5A n=1 Tax=Hibiscus syriacus TaxID=106335 RepID=A0A6A3AKF3_HIBSY|nr:Dynamin-related protein 5A [Hibiscus syriacus]
MRAEFAHCPNLTIIDTPGFVLKAKKGEPGNTPDEILSMVKSLASPPHRILLFLQQSSVEWCSSLWLDSIREIDPTFRRTIVVVSMFDNRLKEFSDRWEVDRYLSASGYLGENTRPFFVALPKERNAVSNDEFRRQISQVDAEVLRHLHDRIKGGYDEEKFKPYIGFCSLRECLESKLQKRYKEAAPATLALLEQRCSEVNIELTRMDSKIQATSDVSHLRKSAMMHAAYICNHVGVLIDGAADPSPEHWGKTAEEERSESELGSWPGVNVDIRPANAVLRLYGRAAFERVMHEFRCAAYSIECPPVSREKVANILLAHAGRSGGRGVTEAAAEIARIAARSWLAPLLDTAYGKNTGNWDGYVGFHAALRHAYNRFINDLAKQCKQLVTHHLDSVTSPYSQVCYENDFQGVFGSSASSYHIYKQASASSFCLELSDGGQVTRDETNDRENMPPKNTAKRTTAGKGQEAREALQENRMTVPETPSPDQPCDVVYARVKNELWNCIEVGPRKRIARMTVNRNNEQLAKVHNGGSLLFGNGDTRTGSSYSEICSSAAQHFARIREVLVDRTVPSTLNSGFLTPCRDKLVVALGLALFAVNDEKFMDMFIAPDAIDSSSFYPTGGKRWGCLLGGIPEAQISTYHISAEIYKFCSTFSVCKLPFQYGINRHRSWGAFFRCLKPFLMEFNTNAKSFTHKKINDVLDEMNFLLWKQQILLTIRSHRLERFLTGAVTTPPETIVNDDGITRVNDAYENFVAQDSALASWLLSTISNHLLPQFVGAETAAAVWNIVLQFFANRSTTAVMSLHYKLQSLKKGGDSMRTYLTRVKEVCDALASCGSVVPQVEHIASVLKGLPREYQPFMAVITSMRETLSLDNIYTMLLDAETQLASLDDQLETLPMSANVAQRENQNFAISNSGYDHRPGTRTGGRGRGRLCLQCQLCGKIGHLVDRCWHRFDENFSCVTTDRGSSHSDRKSTSSAYNSTLSSSDAGCEYCAKHKSGLTVAGQPQTHASSMSSDRWIVDTSATHHVTSDSNNVLNATEFLGPGKLLVGNGMPLNVVSTGHSHVCANSHILLLNNLLLVPQITKNLLSVSKLARDNDVFLEFHANRCYVRDEKTRNILLQGDEHECLYSFSMNNNSLGVNLVEVNTSSVSYSLEDLWHRRLGHPAAETLVKIAKEIGIKIHSNVNKTCVACHMGKSHRLPFVESNTSVDSPFNLVYSDLWGPPHMTSNGFRFYVSFVDAFIRHTWIYLLKTKGEVVLAFRMFQKLVANQFGSSIKALQTDWGGEFRTLSPMLASEGILHRLTCPHTSEQNGVVERKHRHVIELALVLLAQASLPVKYWSYAVVSAVHLINRLPTAVLQGVSPFEKLYGKKPDYTMMRVFGCQCFPHLRLFQKHKLAFRSQICTYLGINHRHKGFQCLASDGKVYISRHVVFNEFIFPFAGQAACESLKSLEPTKSVRWSSQPLRVVARNMPSALEQPTVNDGLSFDSSDAATGSVGSPDSNRVNTGTNITEVDDAHESTSAAAESGSIEPATDVCSSPAEPNTDEATDACNSPAEPDTDNHRQDIVLDSSTMGSSMRVHPMMTRSRCGIFKPKVFFTAEEEDVPTTINVALKSPHWSTAVHEEYNALQKNGTWSLVNLPEGRTTVGCKWIFRIKRNPDGTVLRYKARLVTKGFSQTPDFDFGDTFSPVVRFSTFNTVLSIVVSKGWELRHVDINNAFLHGDLNEDVYMQQPPGFEQTDESGKPLVCKLLKALYGLRQTPRNWHIKLKESLLQLGFTVSRADSSLFVKQSSNGYMYVLVYVDDIVITGQSSTLIEETVSLLQARFSLKDLGDLSFFLGIEVQRINGSILLSQKKYILELLEKTGMMAAAECATPMVAASKLSNATGDLLNNASDYRSIVGSLLYICHTRPDISFSVGQVAQYMHAPREDHFVAVKRILRYLRATLNFGLFFSPVESGQNIVAFADADWGASIDDRRSITGYGVFLGKCLVTWCSKKQKTVSRSTMEAEYKSVADAAADIAWVNALLTDLGIQQGREPIVWCDKTSTVAMSANPVYHAQSKHVDLDVHFVREKVAAGQLQVSYVPAMHQIADGFTKPLARAAFEEFRSKVCVYSFEQRKQEVGKMLAV